MPVTPSVSLFPRPAATAVPAAATAIPDPATAAPTGTPLVLASWISSAAPDLGEDEEAAAGTEVEVEEAPVNGVVRPDD